MATNKPITIGVLFERLTAPLTVVGAFVGGIVWLTSLNDIAKRNEKDIAILKAEFRTFEGNVYDRLSKLDEKLARIEGKLDIIVDQRKKP